MRFSFKLTKQDLASFHKFANRRLTEIAKANSKLLAANLVAWIPLGIAMAAYAVMYLFLDYVQALIVPKSALGSPEDLFQFRSWSRIGKCPNGTPHSDARSSAPLFKGVVGARRCGRGR